MNYKKTNIFLRVEIDKNKTNIAKPKVFILYFSTGCWTDLGFEIKYLRLEELFKHKAN